MQRSPQIEALLKQVGWGSRIQGIVTISDLDNWYTLCLSKKHRKILGGTLINDVWREFQAEFPSSLEIAPFIEARQYHKLFNKDWTV